MQLGMRQIIGHDCLRDVFSDGIVDHITQELNRWNCDARRSDTDGMFYDFLNIK